MPDRPARSQSLYRLSYRAHSGRRVIPCEWTDKRVDRDDEAQVALESLETRLRQHFFERPLCLPPLKTETETHTPRWKDKTMVLGCWHTGEYFVLVTGDLRQSVPGKSTCRSMLLYVHRGLWCAVGWHRLWCAVGWNRLWCAVEWQKFKTSLVFHPLTTDSFLYNLWYQNRKMFIEYETGEAHK
jgi:hypothetical protein